MWPTHMTCKSQVNANIETYRHVLANNCVLGGRMFTVILWMVCSDKTVEDKGSNPGITHHIP